MPIYEYRCKKCGKQFEYMQRMSESPKRKCEACGALALERLISQTSFQLKGSGWYKDLYSSKPGSGSDSATGSDSGSGAGSDSGSDKPAAGADKPAAATTAPKEKSASTGEKKTPKKKGSA